MSLLTVMAEDSGDVLDSWEDQVDSGVIHQHYFSLSSLHVVQRLHFNFVT